MGTSTPIANRLRRSTGIRERIRRLRTAYWSWRYGLRDVDPTFLLSWDCLIHPDFRAGPYGFMNTGCRIGPASKSEST